MVTLDASGSSDPDGDPLTYQWLQTSGRTVTLTGANTANPSFEAIEGEYVFRLIVTDDGGARDNDSVRVVVLNVKRASRR